LHIFSQEGSYATDWNDHASRILRSDCSTSAGTGQFYLLAGAQYGAPTRATADLGIMFATKENADCPPTARGMDSS